MFDLNLLMKQKENFTCGHCGSKLNLELPVNVPRDVRSNAIPTTHIAEYRITSDQLATFLEQKSNDVMKKMYEKNNKNNKTHLVPPKIDLKIIPKFTKSKNKNAHPSQSFGSLLLMFSDEILENGEKNKDFFLKLGEKNSSPKVENSIYMQMIKRYRYDTEDLRTILKSYKLKDKLEREFGMTETFIRQIEMYSIPKRIKENNTSRNRHWIFLSAKPRYVIADYLEPKILDEISLNGIERTQWADELIKYISIERVNLLNKNTIEYIVHVRTTPIAYDINPLVEELFKDVF